MHVTTKVTCLLVATALACGGDVEKPDEVDAGNEPSIKASCPDARGPALVLIEHNGQAFCIDATSTTQREYAEFLDKKTDTECTDAPIQDACVQKFAPETTPDHPVGCASYCHAKAYCEWVGKRLCGKIGGGEDIETNEDFYTASEWYLACSNGGATRWPYGDEQDSEKCWLDIRSALLPVNRSPNECRGASAPFDEVTDMIGNGMDWVAGTKAPDGSRACRAAGYEACDQSVIAGCEGRGIRCCADAVIETVEN